MAKDNLSDSEREFLLKVNDMKDEDLVVFLNIASGLKTVGSILGVTIILVVLLNPNIFVIFGGVYAVYAISRVAGMLELAIEIANGLLSASGKR